jgi:nitroreductase
MFPVFMRSPKAKRNKAMNEEMDSSLGRPIQTSPVMLIVVFDPRKRAPASEGDFLGIVSLGCVMENMWLMAHSQEIGFHVLSVLSSDAVEKTVKNILNIPKHLKIAFAFRLGHPISAREKYLRCGVM